jgi:hypothetical protein
LGTVVRSSILKGSIKKEDSTTPVDEASHLNSTTTAIQQSLLDPSVQRQLILSGVSSVRLIECGYETDFLKTLPKISDGIFVIKGQVYGEGSELEILVDGEIKPPDSGQLSQAFINYLMEGAHE